MEKKEKKESIHYQSNIFISKRIEEKKIGRTSTFL